MQSAQIRAPIENERTSSKFCFRTLIRIGLLFTFGTIDYLRSISNSKPILNGRFTSCIGFKKIILPTCSSYWMCTKPRTHKLPTTTLNHPPSDHMNQSNKYVKTLLGWASDLGLTGRIFLPEPRARKRQKHSSRVENILLILECAGTDSRPIESFLLRYMLTLQLI